MKSYIINLEFRKDRLERLNYNCIQNYTIFKAIHFSSLSDDEKNYYKEKLLTNDNKIDSDGAIGCFISHYKVLCEIANQNENDYVYVFEDDVEIVHEQVFKNIEQYIPKGFDIIMLGGVYGNKEQPPLGFYIPNFNKAAFCTEAYIVSKKGAKKIINFIENKTFTSHGIDWYFHYLGEYGHIKYYGHEPLLTTQNHRDSNITL